MGLVKCLLMMESKMISGGLSDVSGRIKRTVSNSKSYKKCRKSAEEE